MAALRMREKEEGGGRNRPGRGSRPPRQSGGRPRAREPEVGTARRASVPDRAPGVGDTRPGRTRATGALLVALLAFLLYVPGFGNGFAYDAEVAVERDTRVHSLSQPGRLLVSSYWAFDQERLALYRPVVTLSFAVDWVMYRGRPAGFHITNALAHAATAALVFLLLSGMATLPAALAGAALFAAHPVHTEAVAGIVGRADIFAAGFSFAALHAWTRLPARSTALRVLVPLLFLLALGSKESAIMLPALLVLVDTATGRLSRTRLREWLGDRMLPFAALVLVAVAYIALRHAVLGVLAPQSLNPIMLEAQTTGARLRTALQVWPEILRLLFFPLVLLADYGPRVLLPAETWTPRALAGLVILLGAVGGGVWALVRGHRRAGLALLWTPVALFPVSNLVVPIGVLLAERTLYSAVFGLAVGAAALVDVVTVARPQRQRAALAVLAVIVLLFGARTVTRLPAWSSTERVFATLLRDRPDSWRAQWEHARMAWERGAREASLAHYHDAVQLWPYSRPTLLEAGTAAAEMREPHAARWFAEQALEHFPEDAIFLRRLAVAAMSLNDTTAARAAVERGLRVEPDDPLFNMMGQAIGVRR